MTTMDTSFQFRRRRTRTKSNPNPLFTELELNMNQIYFKVLKTRTEQDPKIVGFFPIFCY